MFCFKACFLSKHFWLSFLRKLLLSRFYFSVIFCRSRDQTKQTSVATPLFQCNFLLVVRADNLIWQINFLILSTWCCLNTKVFIGWSMKKKYNFFDIKRSSWIQIRKVLSDAILIMLERTMYLAIILFLVKYWFQNQWSNGKHNANVQTVN